MRIFASPSSYIQGRETLGKAGFYLEKFGQKAAVIADENVLDIVRSPLQKGIKQSSLSITFNRFRGECTFQEISRLEKKIKEEEADIIVGAGGGKALDSAKAVGANLNLPNISLPTIASTDSPTSCVSIVYTKEGEFEKKLVHPSHPDLVLVDSLIIVKAPPRFFISGMGDALATWFEADACFKADGENSLGGRPTRAARAIARLSYDNLRRYGLAAKHAVRRGMLTKHVETIIETNILLSGLGFESGGLAAAHAIHNGLTHMEESNKSMHGEKVCFSLLAQLVLEGRSGKEIEELIDFCISLDLPICLRDLGITKINERELLKISEILCRENERKISNEPFQVTPVMVRDAIMAADEMGEAAR